MCHKMKLYRPLETGCNLTSILMRRELIFTVQYNTKYSTPLCIRKQHFPRGQFKEVSCCLLQKIKEIHF